MRAGGGHPCFVFLKWGPPPPHGGLDWRGRRANGQATWPRPREVQEGGPAQIRLVEGSYSSVPHSLKICAVSDGSPTELTIVACTYLKGRMKGACWGQRGGYRLLPVFFFVFLSFPCRGSQGRGPLAAAALSVRRLFCRPAALRRCRPAGGSLPGPTAAGAPRRPAITTRLCREGRKVCPPPPPVIHDVHKDIPHRRRGVWRERSWIGVSPRALTEELCAFPRRCGGPPPGAVETPPYRALYDIWLLPTPRVAAPHQRLPFPAHTRPEATVAMGVLAKKAPPHLRLRCTTVIAAPSTSCIRGGAGGDSSGVASVRRRRVVPASRRHQP